MRNVLLNPTVSDFFRFFEKVQIVENGCWEWQNATSADGYAQFFGRIDTEERRYKRMLTASRVAHMWFKGAIPPGLQIDHVCCNRSCVNPTHLDTVTHAENMRRSGLRLTHCKRGGHTYTPENTYLDTRGHRVCKTCAVERANARYRRQALVKEAAE